jgi:trehalose/maltose transport system substrate-binding protein
VKHLPAPENAREQLALVRELLQKGAIGPDVYGIDIVWPGILHQELLDLRPYFASEQKLEDPKLITNYTVQGRLVAIPYHTNVGVLFYRADLLQKYGFPAPPKTWNELEKMAIRIQTGERTAGKHNFWGFVWPGAVGEALTCSALEWQAQDGGGRIIESDGRISVNNPNAIHSWKRAGHWVGWISPPSVLSYREWDAINTYNFADGGDSAFLRTWTSDYFLSTPGDAAVLKKSGATSLPGAGVVGGIGLAISRSSAHPAEAIRLVQFLLRREQQLDAARARSQSPQGLILIDLPSVLKAYSHPGQASDTTSRRLILRPSTITGERYERVSRAYFEAVYSVLTRKVRAEDAAAELEIQLTGITGFRPGPPAVKNAVGR